MNEAETKTCSRCKETKPTSEFGIDRSSLNGLYCQCKVCKRLGPALLRKQPGQKRLPPVGDIRPFGTDKRPTWITLDERLVGVPGNNGLRSPSACQFGMIQPTDAGWQALVYATMERRTFDTRREAVAWVEDQSRGNREQPFEALREAIDPVGSAREPQPALGIQVGEGSR